MGVRYLLYHLLLVASVHRVQCSVADFLQTCSAPLYNICLPTLGVGALALSCYSDP